MPSVFVRRDWSPQRGGPRTLPWPARLAATAFVAVVLAGCLNGCTNDDHGRTCPGSPGADMSGRSVLGSDLSQRQMPCVNLERSTLEGSVSDANLSRANLHRTNMRTVWMDGVDLSGADLTDAVGESANLTGVKLVRADLRNVKLKNTFMTDVGLQNARLAEADLRSASLTRTDLGGADARDADFTGAVLLDSNLRGARLDGAKLAHVTWSDVVCPDGSKSSADGRASCDGHLRPAR